MGEWMGGWTHRWTAGWNDGSLGLTACEINWVLVSCVGGMARSHMGKAGKLNDLKDISLR